MKIVPVGYDHPDAVKLVTEVQQVYVVRYGDEDITPVDPGEFAPPRGMFLVGYRDGVPVACGGWRAHDGPLPHFAPGDAEIKRMFVVDDLRGNGLSRVILAEIERTARAAGRRRMILETGTKQPEAIALYESSGYAPIPKFGVYSHDPCSLCYAKSLD